MSQTFTLAKVEPTDVAMIARDSVMGRVHALLRSLATDKDWIVTVDRYRKPRTNLQNKALWGVAYKALREASGNEAEDLHTYFCGEHFGWEDYEVLGMRKRRPKRTTTTGYDGKSDVISTVDLSDFYAFIQRRSAENGFEVPDPDPLWWKPPITDSTKGTDA